LQKYSEVIDIQVMDVELFSLAAVAADEKGKICGFNKEAESLFGYSKEQAIDQNVKMLMPDSVAIHHDSYMRNFKKVSSQHNHCAIPE
jgi:PAS domain S-box-containing protein